jgi:GNAT superfamily N-acetyltransferase
MAGMAGFDIRAATPEDARAIAQTHVASWRATYPGIVPQAYIDSLDVDEFATRWLERISEPLDRFFRVAEMSGVLCGFAAGGPARQALDGYTGELYAIYLLPLVQRRGMGSGLLRSIAAAIAESGHRTFLVWALEQNPACRFYERLGGELLQQAQIEMGGASLVEVAYGWPDVQVLLQAS